MDCPKCQHPNDAGRRFCAQSLVDMPGGAKDANNNLISPISEPVYSVFGDLEFLFIKIETTTDTASSGNVVTLVHYASRPS